jgi:hypothetical protein
VILHVWARIAGLASAVGSRTMSDIENYNDEALAGSGDQPKASPAISAAPTAVTSGSGMTSSGRRLSLRFAAIQPGDRIQPPAAMRIRGAR